MNAQIDLLGQEELARPAVSYRIRSSGMTIVQIINDWSRIYPLIAALAYREGREYSSGGVDHLAIIRSFGRTILERPPGARLIIWAPIEDRKYAQVNLHRGNDGFASIVTVRGRRLPSSYETATDRYLSRMITAPME